MGMVVGAKKRSPESSGPARAQRRCHCEVVASVVANACNVHGVEDTPVEESARAPESARACQKCIASAAEELAGAPLRVLFSLARSEAALVFTAAPATSVAGVSTNN
eukprot:scaffold40750_cov53-Phaeocystis_antarctica.AAC.1